MKTSPVNYGDGRKGLSFRCEGCGGAHTVTVTVTGEGAWQWNGDHERPVLSPSVLVRWDSGPERTPHACHSYVGCHGAAPGEIIFLSDCTHALAGQVRPLPDWTWPPAE